MMSISKLQRAALLALAASAFALPVQAHAVKVCALAQSPTGSVDAAVTKAVFEQLGMDWRAVQPASGGAGGDDDDHTALGATQVAKLLKSQCDVFAGVPLSLQELQARGAEAAPYLDVNFVKFQLDPVPAGAASGVAVAYRAPSQLIAAEEKDADFEVENTSDDVLAAVLSGKTAQGIAWYPSLVAYRLQHPDVRFKVTPTHTNISDWKMSFIADARNAALMHKVRAALDALDRSGDLQRLRGDYALPGAAAHAAAVHARDARGYRLLRVADVAAAPTQADFAAAQVGPGGKLYAAECAMCHGAKLEGRTAPALVGQGFAPAAGSTMTVGGIYQYMTTNMPAEKPGQLKPAEYADIMAFLLSTNGYAPSGKELSPDHAGDDQTPFDSFVK
jgi:mono/diheme cytochrome c family protein